MLTVNFVYRQQRGYIKSKNVIWLGKHSVQSSIMNRSFLLKTKYMNGVGFKYTPSPHGYQSTHRQIYKEDGN